MNSVGYRFDFDDRLSADGAWFRSLTASDRAAWTKRFEAKLKRQAQQLGRYKPAPLEEKPAP